MPGYIIDWSNSAAICTSLRALIYSGTHTVFL